MTSGFRFTLIIFALVTMNAFSQQGKLDPEFNTYDDGMIGDGFDSTVRTLALQSDGKLLVVGDFLNFNGRPLPYIGRLKTDGGLDTEFYTGVGFNGKIYASYIESDGKIILGGNFTSYNGFTAGRIIRLNSDGSYDSSFNTTLGAGNGIIHQIARQPDGNYIIVGSFTTYNGSTVNRVARIRPDGSLDPSFTTGSGGSSNITNIQIQSDGKILLTGNFTTFNSSPASKIVRLNPDGSIDPSFHTGTGFDDDCTALFIQDDGKILVGGKFTQYNGLTANRIVRLKTDGTIDSEFLSGNGLSNGTVNTIQTDLTGNIMLGGSFSDLYNGNKVNRLVLLNPDGTLQSDFDIGAGPASASVLTTVPDLDGSWYIGGSYSVFDSQNQGRLAKIDNYGTHDIGYLSAGVGFDNSVLKVLPLTDTNIIVVGNFSKFNGIASSRIARILSSGNIDSTFNVGNSGANNGIKTIVTQLDGKMILGGSFTTYNGLPSNRIVRILPDGETDSSLVVGDGCNGQVFAMAVQSDQKILVAGNFTKYNGSTLGRIVRLLQNGNIDHAFNAGLGADATIEAMCLQPDGKILLGGRFTTFNGFAYSRLVRLNENGSIDSGFSVGAGFDKNVFSIQLQPDGKIIVGGSFLSYNGITQKRISRLNNNGTLDATFASGTGFSNGEIRSLLVQPDSRILVGGTFSGNYNNTPSLRLLRLQSTGEYDTSFNVTLNSTLYSMQFTEDQKLMIGGNFNSVSGTAKHRIALLKLCNDSSQWDASNWSNGAPSAGKELTFLDDYTFPASANACSCSISSGKTVTILNGQTLGLSFDYSGTGNLILENTASLYQADDDMINTGIIHLKRKSAPIVKFDYTYWSSPVEDQKLIDVSPNTLSDKFFSYDFTIKNWHQELPSSVMTTGKGYIIRGPQNFSTTVPEIYETTFKGVPVNGKIKVTIGEADTFNLIGNPYPSAIDADSFLKQNQEIIRSTLYFWTHNTPIANNKYNQSDYAVYNLLGGVGTRPASASGINETVPDGTITSGQSFFVQSISSGELKFENSMRVEGNNSSFFRPAKSLTTKIPKTEKNRIWLNLTVKGEIFKQLLLGYAEGATDRFDPAFDGEVFNGNQYLNFYSINENKNWVIQGRTLPFQDADVVPLGYSAQIGGDFSITIDHLDGIFTKQSVFLEDLKTNVLHDLKKGSYHFTSDIGTFDDRFQLKFTDKTLHTSRVEFAENESVVVYQNQNQLLVKTTDQQPILKLQIFNMLGQLLYKDNPDVDSITVTNLKPKNQFLIIKIETDSNISAKKVLF